MNLLLQFSGNELLRIRRFRNVNFYVPYSSDTGLPLTGIPIQFFSLFPEADKKNKTRINTEKKSVSMRVSFGPLHAEDEISA